MPRAVDRKIVRLTLLIFLPLALSLNLLVFRLYQAERDSRILALEVLEKEHVEDQGQFIENRLVHIRSDIKFLSDLNEVRQFLRSGDSKDRRIVESIFLNFSRNRAVYDQVRILDVEGMERVRVDARPDRAHVVPVERLQDKSQRYYFRETMDLDADTVYMSPFDLNVEHGEIEFPHVPMIRFGLKIADDSGEMLGIVLLNYFGRDLLPRRSVTWHPVEDHLLLLNSEGFYLFGKREEDEWGFMFADRQDRVFSASDPVAWERFQGAEKGQFYTGEGQYSFVSVRPLQILEESAPGVVKAPRRWFLAAFVPSDSGLLVFRRLAWSHAFLGFGLTGFLLVVIFLMVRTLERERTRALVDPLTTLWNRRSFMERIDRLQGRLSGGGQASIGLIDLGNFKNVNDRCGHHAGDEALVLASKVLLAGVRASDFVGRYGGDEFVILFPDLGTEECERAMKRLASKINEVVVPSCRQVRIVADWGIAHFPSEGDSLRDVLELADERMYKNKRLRKQAHGIPLERETFERRERQAVEEVQVQ